MILGRSGVGKTTLLRALNRLNESFPDCETRGSIKLHLQGRLVDAYREIPSLTELRRQVGMVFQTPSVLPTSIERNLLLTLRLARKATRAEHAASLELLLREVDLWEEVRDRLRHPATTLSGGQQQRLCLARTLALKPEILLLDEPTTSLDFQASRKIEQLLLRLKEQYTIVAVSHSLSQVRRLADHVLILQNSDTLHMLEKSAFETSAVLEKVLEDIF
jgi:phosphate transport system ATP-binding protein